MATPLPLAYRAGLPRDANDVIAPRPAVWSQPTSHAANPTLLFIIVAWGLGLAAVTASLVLPVDEIGALLPHRLHRLAEQPVAAMAPSRIAGHDGAPARPVAHEWSLAPRPTVFPPGSAGGPWTSPRNPQNNVTLWERVRVSTKKDRRGYLLGTAIQLHAPAAAATPGPRRVLLSKEG